MSLPVALLLLRVSVGAFMFVHGAQKLFGWFGGSGLRGSMETVKRKRLRPAWLWGPTAAATMTGGAALTALGLLSPLGPLCIAASMVTVISIDRHKGFFAHRGGNEHAYLYLVSAVALALSGPGDYSLDAAAGIAVPSAVVAAAAALGAVGLLALLMGRERSLPVST